MPRLADRPHLPSVTEILEAVGLSKGFGFMPQDQLLRYRQRGQALHLAINWLTGGTLKMESIHPEVVPGVQGFTLFATEMGFERVASEQEFEHPYGMVGHIDLVGPVGPIHTAVLDVKFTDSPDIPSAKYQIAAYRMGWDHLHPERPAERGYVLQLSPTLGTYKLHDVTDEYAKQVFLAALVVFRARQESGR